MANKKFAIIGYNSMATMPKRVIFATAKTTSFFFAEMVGAYATIALAPHILVPTAINDETLEFNPNRSEIIFATIMVMIIHGTTTVKLFNP